MAKKPNYDFERRERDRMKAEKKAARIVKKNALRESKSEQLADSDVTENAEGQAGNGTQEI